MKNKGQEILQIIMLVFAGALPWIVDLQGIVSSGVISGLSVELEKYLIIIAGKPFQCVIFVFLCRLFISKCNKNYVFNEKGNEYYDYSFTWYWICSKILGYKTCNLARVPIYMQYKLVIKQTFQRYSFGDEKNYVYLDNEIIKVKTISGEEETVNLLLEDTYPLPAIYLPSTVRNYTTIVITRENAGDGNRYISESFCNEVQKIVYQLTQTECKTINLFPTTNAAHNIRIAEKAFMKGGREDIEHLYVFTQPNASKNEWNFSDKGKKIR